MLVRARFTPLPKIKALDMKWVKPRILLTTLNVLCNLGQSSCHILLLDVGPTRHACHTGNIC